MPIYEYQAKEGVPGCAHCRGGFSALQSMKEDALAACPECGGAIERLICAVGIAAPHTNAELKNLGFTKLVKRDSGVYENVTATGGESRYMQADKPETMPHIKKKISD